MPDMSFSEFEKNLRACGVLSDEQLSQALGNGKSDPRSLAKELVERKWLTEWQAKLLLSGRSQMKMGGHVLLERLERNELGDRYLARHQSLDRLVELQFLPKEFDSQSTQFEPFIVSAKMLTEIDHPNLAHVYDVGEEAGRLYVVQEYVNSQPLSHVDYATVSPAQAIRLIREISSAVRFLHDRKILHGSISKNTVLLSRNGLCQLTGLISRILEERVLGRHDAAAARQEALQFGFVDRIAIQGLVGELLEKVLGQQADPELFAAVLKLGQNAEALNKVEEVTQRWLERKSSGQLQSPAKEVSRPVRTPPTATLPGQRPLPAPPLPQRTRGKVGWVFGGIGAALLAIAGLVIWGASIGLFSPRERDTLAKRDSSSPQSRQTDQTSPESSAGSSNEAVHQKSSQSSKETKPTRESKSKRSKSDSTKGDPKQEEDVPSESLVPATPVDPFKTENPSSPPINETTFENQETTSLSDDHFAASLLGATQDKDEKSAQEKSTRTKGESSKKSSSKSSGSDAEKSAGSSQTTQHDDPFVVPGVTPSAKPDLTKETPAMSGKSTVTEGKVETATGLSGIPDALQLPPADGTGIPHVLAPLSVVDPAELVVDLIVDPDRCGRGKNFFSIKATPSKPEWRVFWSTKQDDPESKVVGRFSVENSQLQFAWEQDVEPKSNANYLTNSSLQIVQGNDNRIVPLRKSLEINDLALNEKTFTFRDSLEIPWLPADGVKVEFGTFDPNLFGEGFLANPQMANRAPTTIAFVELLSEQIFWIAVSADFKGKADLRIEVQTRNERGVVPLSPRTLDEVLLELGRRNEQLVRENNLAQEILGQTPPGTTGIGKKREDAKAAEKKMKEAQVFRGKAEEQALKVRNLIGVPLPLRIVYEFQNQKIELARTSSFTTEPYPPPDSKRK